MSPREGKPLNDDGPDGPDVIRFEPREPRFHPDEWEPEFIELHQQVQDQAGEIAALREEVRKLVYDVEWLYAAVLALQAAAEARKGI